MKKSILFFVTLVGLLCFASCQKPEGDDFNSSFAGTDSTGLFQWKVAPNVDFADIFVKSSLPDTLKKVNVNEMTLYCFERPADTTTSGKSDIILRLIEKPIEITKTWEIMGRVGGLLPEKDYGCFLQVDDFFGIHNSDTVYFATKGTTGGSVLVTTDSAKIDGENNELFLYGSVRSHFRALDTTKLELKFRYGSFKDNMDNVLTNYVIDYCGDTVADTVTIDFHCSMPLVDSCWYQAFVKDSWENEYSSTDTLLYSNKSPEAVWAKDIVVEGSTKATLYGNSEYHGGEVITLKKRGFCYAEHPNPTMTDSVWYDDGVLEWNKKYSHTLTGLKPNTKYYCRVFLMLTDEVNDAIFNAEEKDFTTENPVTVTLDMPSDITPTSVELRATIEETQHEIEACKFLWREINNPNDQGILTFENAGDNVIDCMLNEDLTFVALIENLKPAQKYVFGAYIKLTNGEESFSNTQQVSTEEE